MALDINLNDPYYRDKTNAIAALYNVMDPELFVNIIDLGLVYGIEFKDEQIIEVTMTFSTRHCPLGEAIKQGVKNVLSMAFPNHQLIINVVWEPEWNFEMLSDEGRAELGLS
jgi:metal-sulfur cluster biosynthetic enzyme